MKKNKVHFNGFVEKFEKNVRRAIPYIKVLEILNYWLILFYF